MFSTVTKRASKCPCPACPAESGVLKLLSAVPCQGKLPSCPQAARRLWASVNKAEVPEIVDWGPFAFYQASMTWTGATRWPLSAEGTVGTEGTVGLVQPGSQGWGSKDGLLKVLIELCGPGSHSGHVPYYRLFCQLATGENGFHPLSSV